MINARSLKNILKKERMPNISVNILCQQINQETTKKDYDQQRWADHAGSGQKQMIKSY